MSTRKNVAAILILLLLGACSGREAGEPARLVDPFIGTGGHGHTYPGAVVPFGMVQVSPDTRLSGWDGCSGYHYSDSLLYGFSHTHLSGTGASDYGDILFMPTLGSVRLVRGDAAKGIAGYASTFSHRNEAASPGYYRVKLDNGVRVELTATPRVALHRYTFPGSDSANVIIDLQHRDPVIASYIVIGGDSVIEGYRRSKHWAEDQIVFFSARFSKPFIRSGIAVNDTLRGGITEAVGTNLKAFASFKTKPGEQILVKVALSPARIEGARGNAAAEIPGWDFDDVRGEARRAWNEALSKIEVSGASKGERVAFYTALYHAMLAPNLFMDADGEYRGRDHQVHKAEGYDYYTVFSLWDTYRAEHPLFTIIEPERTVDFIKTFIAQFEQGGALPIWELAGNETFCMIGYHAVPVIADAYVKGIRGFDTDKALEAMKGSADADTRGLAYYKTLGYIPSDKEGESVSKTLEYAYDDWCIAQMARGMGREADYARYIERAQFFENVFDPSSGFMRAKANGAFVTPFNPAEVNFNYTEANAWQYSFYVPQDVAELVSLMGGPARFGEKLDSLFTASSATSGIALPDISGMIGQYAHGNEPSHHMAYLYSYVGEPWETQERARYIMRTLYGTGPGGLCGNEDCGQMSAWYVLSALGFYPVTPGSTTYVIGSPLFREASIDVGGGKRFVIRAQGASDKNIYIQSVSLGGKPYAKSYITHADITAGGELAFVMGPTPNKSWGGKPEDEPVSAITDHLILPVPYVASGSRIFSRSTEVALASIVGGAEIRYTLSGAEPTRASALYAQPISVTKTTVLKAIAFKEGFPPSRVVTAEFRKIPGDRSIELLTSYSPMYTAGGDLALIDGVTGGTDFRTGSWQGYEGVDLDAIVDLGSPRPVRRITTGFLQDQNSWIFFPEHVEYSLSTDGKTFTAAAEWSPGVPAREEGARITRLASGRIGRTARYVQVHAKNIGVCPPWHEGAGNKAWLFVDEITIE